MDPIWSYCLCGAFILSCADSLIIPEELPSILSLIYANIPPIKKGTDSRVGVGFRLGPHADFQVLLELGPQRETLPLGPNDDTKKRRQIKPILNPNQYSPDIVPNTPAGKWLTSWKSGLINNLSLVTSETFTAIMMAATRFSEFNVGMGCEITTCSFVTAPLTSHSQPVPDRRKELFLFVTVETASLQYCTVDGSTKQLRIRSVYQRLALLLVSLSQAALEQVQRNLAPRLCDRLHCNRSGVTLLLVSLSHAALEQVQSNLAPRLCDRLRCNRSGATLFLYAPEIFWSSRTVERKWIRCVLVIALRSGPVQPYLSIIGLV
ncbi:unnamed protein product [Timema podura]|uniref:Uncharacterized protein n=1 Tax=Timema podura TaxID=61482 RepID=A0ABN7NDV8_TIMPD|nr:unnamed protein product [Timema podura]